MNIVIKLLIITMLLGLAACSSAPTNTQSAKPSVETPPAEKKPNVDPFEGFNRAVFAFNDGFDTVLLKPIAQGYHYITPDFVENRFSNFFSNLSELRNILNAILQGKGERAGKYTGRFLFNSTLGLAGFFDVASEMGLEKTGGEDFGQTLAVWGVDSGPYLVLPFFGPSTVRDGVAFPVDYYSNPTKHFEQTSTADKLDAMGIIDTRVSLLEAEKLINGDKYIFIRDAYLQRRQYLINDGVVEDDFGGDVKGDF